MKFDPQFNSVADNFDWKYLVKLLHYIKSLLYMGSRHFDRCSVSPEMFVWLHLISPVTVDWTGGSETRSACSLKRTCLSFGRKHEICAAALADLGGARYVHPCPAQNFCNFYAVFGKNWSNSRSPPTHLRSWCPGSGNPGSATEPPSATILII